MKYSDEVKRQLMLSLESIGCNYICKDCDHCLFIQQLKGSLNE